MDVKKISICPTDYAAFERVLAKGLVSCDLAEDWSLSSHWRWMRSTDPDPVLLSAWAVPRSPNSVDPVNAPLTEKELTAIRKSAHKGGHMDRSNGSTSRPPHAWVWPRRSEIEVAHKSAI